MIYFLFISYIFYILTSDVPFSINGALNSNMVLQREPYKATVWGTAPISSKVTVTFDKNTYEAVANTEGNWKLFLNPYPASEITYDMKIINSISTTVYEFTNILFGDVYLCSGQSNMEFIVKDGFNATQTFEESKTIGTLIRLFTVTRNYNISDVTTDVAGHLRQNWSVVSPQALGINAESYTYFSAVCYYFGLHLFKTLHIPIGLIGDSWGGTIMEIWTPPESLKLCTGLKVRDDVPNKYYSSLWNGMIYPMLPYTIKGALWYQGEANVPVPGNYTEKTGYSCLFPEMIKGWRKGFSELGGTDPEFPFGFVQLAGYCGTGDHLCSGDNLVQEIRFATTSDYGYVPNPRLKNVFMATAVDYPDPLNPNPPYGDIHPRNKLPVGTRLAKIGLNLIYGQKNFSLTGPYADDCSVDDKYIKVVVNSSSIEGDRLILNDNYGFTYKDNTNTWIKADTSGINGNTVYIEHNGKLPINSVRYLWSGNPCCPDAYKGKTPFTCPQKSCPIYSERDELPLLTFRYDIFNNKCIVPMN